MTGDRVLEHVLEFQPRDQFVGQTSHECGARYHLAARRTAVVALFGVVDFKLADEQQQQRAARGSGRRESHAREQVSFHWVLRARGSPSRTCI